MATRKSAPKPARRSASGFTAEELSAMRERARELKARTSKEAGEREVLAKISKMETSDRVMAERIHAILKEHAPALAARTWYGMPAYSKDDRVICFFRDAAKFKTRYATLGFSDEANLDDGRMWPTDFALKELTPVEEAKIVGLVKKAVH
jgi:uncharacterized protein YdhG (YjbR/CyaY superfamily)